MIDGMYLELAKAEVERFEESYPGAFDLMFPDVRELLWEVEGAVDEGLTLLEMRVALLEAQQCLCSAVRVNTCDYADGYCVQHECEECSNTLASHQHDDGLCEYCVETV